MDLAIRPGECLGLVGHNGAGKSTLVNLVTGLFAPSDGRVVYPGADGPLQAGVRAISQEGTLCPNLTWENLSVVQRNSPSRQQRQLVPAIAPDLIGVAAGATVTAGREAHHRHRLAGHRHLLSFWASRGCQDQAVGQPC
ncbi:ATP-binding cassette domain-containing protein [Paracoccus mutanolyticus]|uniref:ATP-binding cassette domain-containing protein n=1 Tax=Paracoccus mutanolyticus TaxID=1499308 RepID=UPI0021D532E8|nr:ATP-binding cassette domain-containing protein [Paracoccus mutanolyticus]